MVNYRGDKEWEIIGCMEDYGGSFVKALAGCLTHADPTNYQKLKTAFPEYFMEYAKMAFGKKEEK
jgi:hypothetical protein